MFDYGENDTCIWCVNQEAEKKLGGYIVPPERLQLSDDLRNKIKELSDQYQSSLNWDDPKAGTPWTAEQIESFRVRAQEAYDELVEELGGEFEVQNLIDMCLEF